LQLTVPGAADAAADLLPAGADDAAGVEAAQPVLSTSTAARAMTAPPRRRLRMPVGLLSKRLLKRITGVPRW